jgi:hypothetical protein
MGELWTFYSGEVLERQELCRCWAVVSDRTIQSLRVQSCFWVAEPLQSPVIRVVFCRYSWSCREIKFVFQSVTLYNCPVDLINRKNKEWIARHKQSSHRYIDSRPFSSCSIPRTSFQSGVRSDLVDSTLEHSQSGETRRRNGNGFASATGSLSVDRPVRNLFLKHVIWEGLVTKNCFRHCWKDYLGRAADAGSFQKAAPESNFGRELSPLRRDRSTWQCPETDGRFFCCLSA